MTHLLAGLLLCGVPAQDAYLETLVRLETPKKDAKRSREGGADHAPFRIWIPEGVSPVRGLVFNPYYTKAVTQEHWQAACRLWGFGILAANFFGVKSAEFPAVIDKALDAFAEQGGRPELAKAKLCPVGMSAGAGMCTRIAEGMPDRVIAMGPVCLEVGPRGQESMPIPALTVFGERDGKQYEKLMAKLPEVRAQGGRFGIAVQWRRKHEFARANNLLMPLFDAAIRKRLGDPGGPLKPYEEEEGWLGDVSSWRDGPARIAPYAEFEGDKAGACWFPDARTAHAWRAFVTREPALVLEIPPGLGDGQPFILQRAEAPVAVKIKGSPEVEGAIAVYGGADRLGELKDGVLEVRFDTPGIYPLYLEARGADGAVLLSRPNTLVVAPAE